MFIMLVTNNKENIRYLFYTTVGGIPKSVKFGPLESLEVSDLESENQIIYNSLDYKLKGVNERFRTGFDLDFTIGGVTVTTYFLDVYTGATVAYSFNQLSREATTSKTIRRSSDDAELDIGFIDGDFDEQTVLDFIGSDDFYYVRDWDQSGNGNHRVQLNKLWQPKGGTAGVILKKDGSPVLYYDGVDDCLQLTTNLSSTQPWSAFHKFRKFANTSLGPVLSNTADTACFVIMDNSDTSVYTRSPNGTTVYSTPVPTSGLRVYATAHNASNRSLWAGNASLPIIDIGINGVGNFTTFGRRESSFSKGWEHSFFFYQSDMSSNVRDINAFLTGGVKSLPSSATTGYIIPVWGQSNATDRFTISGNLSTELQQLQSDSWTHFKIINNTTDNGFWCRMHAGINTTTEGGIEGYFSMSVSLAARLKSTYNKAGYIVPDAIGGTGLVNAVTPGWYPTHVGEYYDKAILHFTQALAQASAATVVPVLIWNQGEFEAGDETLANAYESALTTLIQAVRTDSGLPNLKVVITQLRSDTIYAYRNIVRTAQANVAANMTNVYLFNTSAFPISSDGEHYNPISPNFGGTQSAILMGEALADLIATF